MTILMSKQFDIMHMGNIKALPDFNSFTNLFVNNTGSIAALYPHC